MSGFTCRYWASFLTARMYADWFLGLSLRIVMSSVMRWRKRLMDLLESVMGLSPVMMVAVATTTSTQDRPYLKFIDNIKSWHPYRASGLVRWPTPAISSIRSCNSAVGQ